MKVKQLFFGLMLYLSLSFPVAVWAHGAGGVQRMNIVPAGPYQVSLWTEPEPLSAGTTVHFNAAVSIPPEGDVSEAGPPVFDATVILILTPPDGSDAITLETSHEGAVNKLFYDADFKFPVPGDWHLKVVVDGKEGHGEAEAIIGVEKELGGPIWIWITTGGAFVLVAGFFVFRAFRHEADEA